MGLSSDPIKRANQLANIVGHGFKKGNKCSKGRPRMTISHFVKEFEKQGMTMPSRDEIAKIYFYIAARTEKELKEILGDKELPMMMRIIARGVLDKKGLDVLERIVDRSYGKERRIDLTSNGKELHVEPLQIHFIADKEALAKVQAEVKPINTSRDNGQK